MPEDVTQSERGVLIRGADGHLYYVAESQLQRLPDEQTEEARRYLDRENIKAAGSLWPGIEGSGLVQKMPERMNILLISVDNLKEAVRKRTRKSPPKRQRKPKAVAKRKGTKKR